jgi:hypothetical protein
MKRQIISVDNGAAALKAQKTAAFSGEVIENKQQKSSKKKGFHAMNLSPQVKRLQCCYLCFCSCSLFSFFFFFSNDLFRFSRGLIMQGSSSRLLFRRRRFLSLCWVTTLLVWPEQVQEKLLLL